MLSDAARAALRDMEYRIDLATQFTAGLRYEAFRYDTRTIYAVTRCLEIISEASRRLPEGLRARLRRLHGKIWPGRATYSVMTTRTLPQSSYETPFNWPYRHYGM